MSEKENILFRQTFDGGILSLTIKLKGLVDKRGVTHLNNAFYDNRCEFILELSSLEEGKPLYLLTRITTFINDVSLASFKGHLISLKHYLVFLYLEHRLGKSDNRGFVIETLDELIVFSSKAIREDKKVIDYWHLKHNIV